MLNGNNYNSNTRSDDTMKDDGDEMYMMAGDDPSAYFLPAPEPIASALHDTASFVDDDDSDEDDDDDDDAIYRRPMSHFSHSHQNSDDGVIVSTNSTNQMLDVVNNKRHQQQQQRRGNRRQNNRNRHRNSQNQNDGASFDEGNPINVISAFNRTGKIYNKLRKNDAVKVVDTPSGRAGFVYQSSSNSNSGGSLSSNSNNQESPLSPSIRENGWEDDGSQYSQQNQFVNRNANDVKLIPSSSAADDTNNKKILPVLTKDGKIALVVRGDTSRNFDENQNNGSGNSINTKKYEPITNLTSIITALNSNNNNNDNNNLKHNDSINVNLGNENPELKSIQEQNRLINRLDDFFASVTNKVKHIEEEIEHKLGIDLEEIDSDEGQEADDDGFHERAAESDSITTTTQNVDTFGEEDRKGILLINRPLSEVLGLPKKTHYHYPHDPMQPSISTSEMPHSTRHNENRRIDRIETTIHHPPPSTTTTTEASQAEEFDLESPEKINIAVIPRFDSELEERLFGKTRENSNRNLNEISQSSSGSASTSPIHGAIQAMISIACACAIFGVVGTFYRIELANHIRIIYW